MSCGNDDGITNGEENTETGNSYNGKTVDEKFWGEWKDDFVGVRYEIRKTVFIEHEEFSPHISPAWSEGDIFFRYNTNTGNTISWTLQNDGTLKNNGSGVNLIRP
jgi:hypothetical protein